MKKKVKHAPKKNNKQGNPKDPKLTAELKIEMEKEEQRRNREAVMHQDDIDVR